MPAADSLLDRYNTEYVKELAVRLRGQLVVLDGPDGTGKTTQLRLLEALLRRVSDDVLVVRDPGGTAIGEAIREIVLHSGFDEMRVNTEMLLFMASRAQLVQESILPAMRDGYVILCDRFISSTYAYQSWLSGCGVKPEHEYLRFKTIRTVSKIATQGLPPSQFKTFIFHLDLASSMKRMQGGEIEHHGARSMHAGSTDQLFLFGDRIELKAAIYMRKVVAMYKRICDKWPDRYIAIDASGTPETVFNQLLQSLKSVYHVTPVIHAEIGALSRSTRSSSTVR